MNFEEYVKQHISKRLDVEYLLDQIQYGLLRDIVEECFLAEGFVLSDEKKAIVILSGLFAALVRGFDFNQFLHSLPQSEQKNFLSTLLLHIYYRNMSVGHLASCQSLQHYLMRTVALTADASSIALIYDGLDFSAKLKVIGYCLKFFDEGSYRILRHAMCYDTHDIQKLLALLDRKIISEHSVIKWLDAIKCASVEDLQLFLEDQEKETRKAIAACKKYLPHTLEEISRFCAIYGLYGHQSPNDEDLIGAVRLDKKLKKAKNDAFTNAISSHIHALGNAREKYLQGIANITYALPTAGKDLRFFAWIPSLVVALEGFCQELNIANTIPIFILDQSEPDLFAKNAAYIKTLSKNCIHLNAYDMITLAKKLNIEKLLETDSDGRFGYGGARNAIFLLMPLLRKLLDNKISKDTLEADFRKIVLEESENPCVIHMGDDDVHVPFSTVFSDALFASEHSLEYFCRYGWVKGRRTTWTQTSFSLEYLLEHTSDILLQHTWQDEPFKHGMSGLLTKPKLCLNVPFGQEEAYLKAMKEYSWDIRHPMLHLSGYRLPTSEITTNRFSGLAAFLKIHYNNTVGALLVTDLLDPQNLYKRCALPWNKLKKTFTSLENAIEYIVNPKVIQRMQTAFEKNVANLEKGLKNYEKIKLKKSNLALFHIGVLETQNVDAILLPYSRFANEVQELKSLFTELSSDAKAFKAALVSKKKLLVPENQSMTHSLQLLLQVIREASFQQILSHLLREPGTS